MIKPLSCHRATVAGQIDSADHRSLCIRDKKHVRNTHSRRPQGLIAWHFRTEEFTFAAGRAALRFTENHDSCHGDSEV